MGLLKSYNFVLSQSMTDSVLDFSPHSFKIISYQYRCKGEKIMEIMRVKCNFSETKIFKYIFIKLL